MQQVVNKSAPTFGGAIGYFVVTAYLIPQGYLAEAHVAEGVVMSGIICTNILMELRVVLTWFGGLFARKKDE